jgi:hypothetical protein
MAYNLEEEEPEEEEDDYFQTTPKRTNFFTKISSSEKFPAG